MLKKILLIPDTHVPYEDKRAWDLMLMAATSFKPDTVVLLGDFCDFYAVSAHPKDPSRKAGFLDEVASARSRLAELSSLGAKSYYYLEGNHEFRLLRYIRDRAPELFGVPTLSVHGLLGLEKNWTFVPYRKHLKLGNAHLTHEVGEAGAKAHEKAQSAFQSSVLIGHTHRMAVTYSGNTQGHTQIAAMLGWLGDADAIDYMHQIKAMRDWQLGFGVGYLDKSGHLHISPVPIVGYRLVLEGELYYNGGKGASYAKT